MIDTMSQLNSSDLDLQPDVLCDCIHPQAVMDARRAIAEAPAADEMAALFSILGDPSRMRVLVALGSGEMCVTDLALATGMNRTTVSHQLRVLRTHRLVQRRRDGKAAYYRFDDEHVSTLLRLASEHASEPMVQGRVSA